MPTMEAKAVTSKRGARRRTRSNRIRWLRLGKPTFREVIRLPDCKSGVTKYVSEATNWSITSISHQPSPATQERTKAAAPKSAAGAGGLRYLRLQASAQ